MQPCIDSLTTFHLYQLMTLKSLTRKIYCIQQKDPQRTSARHAYIFVWRVDTPSWKISPTTLHCGPVPQRLETPITNLILEQMPFYY